MIRHISIEIKRQARQAGMRLSFHNGDILTKKAHNDFSLWAFLYFVGFELTLFDRLVF